MAPTNDVQRFLLEYAKALPEKLSSMMNGYDRRVFETDTPAIAVQVAIERFNSHSINTPDVWTKIKFTESDPGSFDLRHAVCSSLIELIDRQQYESGLYQHLPFSWAFDGFFDGPGFGCLSDKHGKVVLRW